MGKFKVCVYTIALNEEQFVERWYESVKDADYILIADTGSTDATVRKAEALGINVVNVRVSPWRFDDARNAALAAIPDDIDMCVSLDMDEIITPGWKPILEEAWAKGVNRPTYKHIWSWKEDGTPGLEFGYDHIHARKGFRWRHPVHECVYPYEIEERKEWIDGLETHHHPDPNKSRSQYLPLLAMSVKEDPHNDRNAFYYARELFFHGKLDEAATEFKRHLALPSAQWNAERAASYRYLAKCEPTDAVAWLQRAILEDGVRREAKVELSNTFYEQQNWQGCYDLAIDALQITAKTMDYLCEEFAWGSLPHDLAAISAWYLGKKNESIAHAYTALELSPNDQRLRDNYALISRDLLPAKITAVIPTKSNIDGAIKVIDILQDDPQVLDIIVVLDGDNAVEIYGGVLETKSKVSSFRVDEGVGIHAMWNVGLEEANNTHVVFINDDLIPATNSAGTLASLLEEQPWLGLVCPAYDDRQFTSAVYEQTYNARGIYNNKDGLMGCFMALSKDLAQEFRFDETMKWYHGDDDIVKWVLSKDRGVGITSLTKFDGNESFTTTNDPPANFKEDVANDQKIFEAKWMG